jgi:hypothetical protein
MPRGPRPAGGGYVTRDGRVVAIRSGRSLPLGHLPEPRELYESVAGLVAVTHGGEPSVLLRWDGSRETLGRDSVAKVGEDGRLLAFLETWGRASRPRHRLTVLDLVDGRAAVMPWDEHDPVRLVAVQGGTVHLTAGEHHVTWRPGAAPRHVGDAVTDVDPLTGTTMRPVWGRGAVVEPPAGPPQWFELGGEPHLAPGGRRLWTTRVDPPALTLFPVEGTVADAQVCWLPGDTSEGLGEIVWEDEVHALVPVASIGALEDQRIVRVDTTTGLLESAWEDDDDFWDRIVLAAPYLVRDVG